MRLINVETYELEEFIGSQTPEYAILSHRWGPEEVSFQEWQTGHDRIKHKTGYGKIDGACKETIAGGYKYLWCDTNCIDKSSSAELSEAINSMFAWYRDARICYVYLDDVELKGDLEREKFDTCAPSFRESKWFTRGWTLQELLAPKELTFFSNDWKRLGSRKMIASTISQITQIPKDQLEQYQQDKTSVAARMSWAATRQTTRLEE